MPHIRKYLGINIKNDKKLKEISITVDKIHNNTSMATIKLIQLLKMVNTVKDKKKINTLINYASKINMEMITIIEDIKDIEKTRKY